MLTLRQKNLKAGDIGRILYPGMEGIDIFVVGEFTKEDFKEYSLGKTVDFGPDDVVWIKKINGRSFEYDCLSSNATHKNNYMEILIHKAWVEVIQTEWDCCENL